jgi:2-polyprenyl-3-methyl-5-hydroxy-6-metoxy-1,4-benzoquinol methylase
MKLFKKTWDKVRAPFRTSSGSRSAPQPDPQNEQKSIWDNSAEQYQKNGFKIYWELLPEVAKYQRKCMTGDENLDYFTYTLDYVRKNIGTKNLRALSIGCTEGNPGPEMTIFETGLFSQIDVMDIADGLIAKQAKIAAEKGLTAINYRQTDLNNAALEKNAYDLIWAVGTVHHIEKLESLFERVSDALKDRGIFMMREFVGPNRFQFSDEQLRYVNEILAILPTKYKKTMEGAIKSTAGNYDINELIKIDPSESVRSQDIMRALCDRLDVFKLSNTGGSILFTLLAGIASNFENDEDAEAILKLLVLFERTLVEKNVIPSDYVFSMARKRRP